MLLTEDDLWENYDGFAWCVDNIKPDHVIDNSNLTLQQTVDAIENVLERDLARGVGSARERS